MKTWAEIVLTIVAIGATFLIVNYIHFQFFLVHVVLYSCLLDLLIALVLLGLIHLLLRRNRTRLRATEFSLAVTVAALLVTTYAVMGPTVIDRSLSIYIVQKLNARGGAIAEAAMRDVFVEEYIPEFRLIDVRLTEQVSSGTAIIKDGCVTLTPRGKFIADFIAIYRKTLLPRKRVLMGEVTDALTDPFANAKPVVDTACKPVPAPR